MIIKLTDLEIREAIIMWLNHNDKLDDICFDGRDMDLKFEYERDSYSEADILTGANITLE